MDSCIDEVISQDYWYCIRTVMALTDLLPESTLLSTKNDSFLSGPCRQYHSTFWTVSEGKWTERTQRLNVLNSTKYATLLFINVFIYYNSECPPFGFVCGALLLTCHIALLDDDQNWKSWGRCVWMFISAPIIHSLLTNVPNIPETDK